MAVVRLPTPPPAERTAPATFDTPDVRSVTRLRIIAPPAEQWESLLHSADGLMRRTATMCAEARPVLTGPANYATKSRLTLTALDLCLDLARVLAQFVALARHDLFTHDHERQPTVLLTNDRPQLP